MSRYSVTVKIVHTWYEEIEVEASSEDGAEIIAELENVHATGEPVVDRYVYCNWMVKDTEPTPDEYDAMMPRDEESITASSSEVDLDSILDKPKRSRRRSRKSKSKAKLPDGTDQQIETSAVESGVEPIDGIPTGEALPEIEEAAASDTEAAVEAPKRSRNRSRRSRSKARQMAEAEHAQETVASENAVSVDDAVIEESAPIIEAVEASEVEPAVEAPKRSRNRSRRSRSKARQMAEGEQVSPETIVSEPEIVAAVIEESIPAIEPIEPSDVEPAAETPKKSRSRSWRSRSKARQTADAEQPGEVVETVPENVVPEVVEVKEAAPVKEMPVEMPPSEPIVEKPKKPQTRSRKAKPKSAPATDSEVQQPEETVNTTVETSADVVVPVETSVSPIETSSEKEAAPPKKRNYRKRKPSKSMDDEQSPSIGDDSIPGSDE